MIRHLASAAIAAALMASLPAGCETSDSAPAPAPVPAPAPAPMHKGDPGVPAEPYPTEMAPDERSNGAWMVKGINTDGPGDYYVMCWINSDEATLTRVDVEKPLYDEFLANPDTGSIPCPEAPR